MQTFTNLQQAMKYFKDEAFCREHLAKMRWPDGKVICPKCGQKGAYKYKNMPSYKCKSKTCLNRFSVTVGSLFENTKIPLSKWFVAIWLVSAHKKGVSSYQIARDLGIGQKAGWFLLHRIRKMLEDKAPEKLESVVEIDECYVGGKWKNKSLSKRKQKKDQNGYYPTNKVPVMGMVQRDGKAVVKIIGTKYYDDSFKDLVRKNVTPTAIIITDAHLGYKGLDKEYADHQVVNHSIEEYARGSFHTNTIEGFFSHLKRSILGCYHHVSKKHLEKYCIETAYRYNTRKLKDCDRFTLVLTQYQGRLKYKDLIKKV